MNNQFCSGIFHRWLVLTVVMVLLVSGCDLFGGALPSSDVSVEEALEDVKPPEEPPDVVMEPEVVTLEETAPDEPMIMVDFSQYSAIEDKDFYKGKYLGEIFLIKDWQTVDPLTNTLTIYGKIPFTVHPDQSMDAFEFNDPNHPVVLTGFGEGWAKGVTLGKGGGASTVCTTEIKTEFSLIGAFYPAPACTLDVDIVTTYLQGDITTICEYDVGLMLELPMEEWVDVFTDVKLPIEFRVPDDYVTRYKKTENNVKYDLSYYLYNFWGSPPSAEELSLIFGDTPAQFFNTGCQNVHIAFDTGVLPEGSEWADAPPSAWDVMLTPESQREVTEP